MWGEGLHGRMSQTSLWQLLSLVFRYTGIYYTCICVQP